MFLLFPLLQTHSQHVHQISPVIAFQKEGFLQKGSAVEEKELFDFPSIASSEQASS